MSYYIFSLILLIIALVAIELRKSYHEIPKAELRHRAREGDALAEKLYRAVSYQESLEALLWTIIILCSAGSLILLNVVAPLWLDFIAVALFIWLAFALLPKLRPNAFSLKLAIYLTPSIVAILNIVHPLIEKIYSWFGGVNTYQQHTGLYSKKDLAKLIDTQISQPDNRIRTQDLELIKKALKLSDKNVGQYSKPWHEVNYAVANDAIGPVLLDELHKSDQIFVPVLESKQTKKVVGIVDLNRLDIGWSGEIASQMDPNVNYLKEQDSLEDALSAMSETGRPVFMVVDRNGILVGMITLKDVLSELYSPPQEVQEVPVESDESQTADEPEVA